MTFKKALTVGSLYADHFAYVLSLKIHRNPARIILLALFYR